MQNLGLCEKLKSLDWGEPAFIPTVGKVVMMGAFVKWVLTLGRGLLIYSASGHRRRPVRRTCVQGLLQKALEKNHGHFAHISFFVPDIFNELSVLFTRLAVVTFGGAYAVLAYLAQEAVGPGWLTPAEMIDGLGLAETTPGPLILVVDYVGYMAGARSGGLGALMGGLLGTLIAVWATFVPSFLWIFLGAPWVERIKGGGLWDSALSGVTAAVTGVILNLALWFGLHVLFGEVGTVGVLIFEFLTPNPETFNGPAVIIFALALVALVRLHIGVIPVILGSIVLGLGINWLM